MSQSPEYPDYLGKRLSYTGRSFFPLGFEVELLYSAEGCLDVPMLREPNSFCAGITGLGEKGMPAFSADDFSALFYQWLLSAGAEFHAVRARDLEQDDYIYIYNMLAEAAYEDKLAAMDYAGWELVRGGYVKAAAVSSRSLGAMDHEGYDINCLPRFKDDPNYLADCFGIAVTAKEGRSLRSITAFLSWLSEGSRLEKLALDTALVPAAKGERVAANKLERLLLEMRDSLVMHLPGSDSDYLENRENFEKDFRKAVDMLNYS